MHFIDLKAQYALIRDSVHARIDTVLEHGQYILGPEVLELETRLAAFCGAKHCVSCASGTDALLLLVKSAGIGPGDAVFVPAFTFFATVEVVMLAGATPFLVDIDPATYALNPDLLAQSVARAKAAGLRPKMVIAVDLYGLPADYPALQTLCNEHGLTLIEDAAQSFGGTRNNLKACGFGVDAATSFYPAKPLGGYGEGGAVFTDSAEQAARLRSLRAHGAGEHAYDHVTTGWNARLDTLQAAILLAKLDIFEQELADRRRVARSYRAQLESLCPIQHIPAQCQSAWAQFTIEVAHRDKVRQHLSALGIPTAVHYPRALHEQPACAHLGYTPGDFPAAESAARRVLSLPMHPYLQEEQINTIISALHDVLVP